MLKKCPVCGEGNRNGKSLCKPTVLYNVVLPLFFVEVWSVFLAFIGIVIIEAWVINKILKDNFRNVVKKIIYINFLTTVIGYLLQGIVRLIVLSLVPPARILWDNEFVAGLMGNVGSTTAPMRLLEKEPISTIVAIGTSFLITFIISVVVETRSLRKAYAGNEEVQRLIPTATLKANVVSYCLLLAWVLYYVKTH